MMTMTARNGSAHRTVGVTTGLEVAKPNGNVGNVGLSYSKRVSKRVHLRWHSSIGRSNDGIYAGQRRFIVFLWCRPDPFGGVGRFTYSEFHMIPANF